MTYIKHIYYYMERNALEYPDKPALVCAERTLTWRQLNDETVALMPHLEAVVAQAVSQDEAGRGDKQRMVAILLPNSWECVVLYLAVLKAGHIAMPLDPAMKRLELEAMVSQLRPDLLITDRAHKDDVDTGGSNSTPAVFMDELLEQVRDADGTSDPGAESRAVVLPPERQVATLLFTSGTTGRPKAVPYTHANHVWNVAVVPDLWKWTADDTILLSLPLSHWHGLVMGLMGSLYHGNTLYLHERFDAGATLETLASGKISLFMHVPTAYLKLVNHAPQKRYDVSKVRLFVSGSSYLPPAIWNEFKERFGAGILERYGSSETGLVASNALNDRRPGMVGRLLPGVEVKADEDGELLLRSPGLFPGYYRNEAATKDKIVGDGWWKTGDIGVFNGDILQLKGRIQEKMKKLSYTVYPRDLEWALLKNPKVREVVVIGIQVPDRLDDLIFYFVVGKITAGEIQAYCKANMPAAWRPDRVVVLPEIPKTRSGKPVLGALKQLA